MSGDSRLPDARARVYTAMRMRLDADRVRWHTGFTRDSTSTKVNATDALVYVLNNLATDVIKLGWAYV